jgi:cell division protein FtsZ
LKSAFTESGGKTLFGLGRGEGEDFVKEALKDLFLCPLLHLPDSAVCADKLLVNIIGGTDLSIARVNEIMEVVTERFKSSDNTVMGAVIDERMQNTIEICVIGTTDLSGRKREQIEIGKASSVGFNDDRLEDGQVVHESKLKSKQAKLKADGNQDEFLFIKESQERGFFNNTEKNMYNDQDLDVPTYHRKGLKIVLT